jgi:hypothetical protein
VAYNCVTKERAAIVIITRRLGGDHQFPALKPNLYGHRFKDGDMEAVATGWAITKGMERYQQGVGSLSHDMGRVSAVADTT